MPRFAANLAYLFTERPLIERFGAAAAAGFKAVELQSPYDHTPSALKAEIDKHGLTQLGINTFVGGAARRFRAGRGAGPRARLGRRVQAGARLHGGDRRQRDPLHGRRRAARAAAGGGADLHRQSDARGRPGEARRASRCLIEPINHARPAELFSQPRSSRPPTSSPRSASPNIKIQFDFYHVQIVSGDLITRFEKHLPLIGHVQIAAVPSRAEPDEGEINYPGVFAALDRLGWSGWTACEYKPRARTEDGLGWGQAYRPRVPAAE